MGSWIEIEAERVLYVDRGKHPVLCDRGFPGLVTLLIKVSGKDRSVASEHKLQVHQERTFCSGVLSVTTSFRLVVTGDTELKHLERLIRILKVQKEILEEDECSPETKSQTTSQTTTENATAEATAIGAETERAASTDASEQDGAVGSVDTGDQSMRELGTS
jgi:hypothetical protein